MFPRRTIALADLTACALLCTFVTGCSGGAAGVAPSNGSGSHEPTALGTVRATIVIPAAKKTTGAKDRRQYVSPGTQGLIVTVSQVSNSTTTYSNTGYDLVAPSAACSVNSTTNNTTCTITFNAPATNASQSDLFSIYAYDEPQTAGPLPAANYNPFGALLSEDTGPGGSGDPVPSSTNGNIATGMLTNLTFVLLPVVATPIVSIAGTTASLPTLSVSGSGGSSNVLTVQGEDAKGYSIANYLNAGTGDNVYVNPIQQTLSPPAKFAATPSTVTSATNPTVIVTYTPASGDQPTSATSTALSGTDVLSDSLASGGYKGLSSLPTVQQTVTIAPLFAFAPAAPTSTSASGFSTMVYAIQDALPTGDTGDGNYSLTADTTVSATNDCTDYAAVTGPSPGTNGTSQQAVFVVSTTTTPSAGKTCMFTLSDGISTTPIMFSPTGTPSY